MSDDEERDENEPIQHTFEEAWVIWKQETKSVKEIAQEFWEAGEESRYLSYSKGFCEGKLAGWNDGYNVGMSMSDSSILKILHKEDEKKLQDKYDAI